MKRLVMDLDETITCGFEDGSRDYAKVRPRMEVVEKIKSYKAMGFEIVIFSSRNMRTHENSIGKINAQTLPVIIKWLEEHGVPFDEIHVGKPWCGSDGFYVDDKAIRPREFLEMSYQEIRALLEDK